MKQKQKKLVSILCLILAVIMVLSLVISVLPARAYAVSQSDIDAVRARKAELSQRVAQAQERLDGLKEHQAGVLQQKAALEEQRNSALEELELISQEIAMYDAMIEEKSQELSAALDREQTQMERYRTRVRAMEENGGYNVAALIINSTNFSELLSALDDMGEIMESDKAIEHEYRAARQEVERIKAEYEQLRAETQEKKEALEQEKLGLEAQIASAEEQLAALADQIEDAMAAYEADAAAEEQAAAEMTELIRQYEEEQRRAREAAAAAAAAEAARLAAQQAAQGGGNAQGGGTVYDGTSGGNTGGGTVYDGGGVVYDGTGGGSTGGGGTVSDGGGTASTGGSFNGSFSWPVPSGNTITGRYAEQRSGHTHSGIDIDGYGCDGCPVVAAAAGKVITSSSSNGYGNYVVIDHGNGYTTLYAHMSSNAVVVDQYVAAGQTIGFLGATGNASGTHCHFEIRINGATVDPEAWFPGLPHWNC